MSRLPLEPRRASTAGGWSRHHRPVDVLTALLVELIVIAVLFEIARRLSLPYPALFVLGGLALGFVPWIPHITLEPDLVLLVFLPPLLFGAAFETPLRDLRTNLWPIARLSVGLVSLTTIVVAAVAQALVPGLGWAAAFALGAIVAPTDALAATSVFRRLGVPRIVLTLIEGEALFNDATALILYRGAVVAPSPGRSCSPTRSATSSSRRSAASRSASLSAASWRRSSAGSTIRPSRSWSRC